MVVESVAGVEGSWLGDAAGSCVVSWLCWLVGGLEGCVVVCRERLLWVQKVVHKVSSVELTVVAGMLVVDMDVGVVIVEIGAGVVAAEFVVAERKDTDVAAVVAGKSAAELAAAVAERSAVELAAVVAAAKLAVEPATVVAGRSDAASAAVVAVATVSADAADVAAVAAGKSEAGLAAVVVAALQAAVVARGRTHASMVLPDGKLASDAGPWGETASRALVTH